MVGSSGKILKSGPNDRVFVYYADHGAPGTFLVSEPCSSPVPCLTVFIQVLGLWQHCFFPTRVLWNVHCDCSMQQCCEIRHSADSFGAPSRHAWAHPAADAAAGAVCVAWLGILGMPNGAFLYADQLLEVLTAKSEQGGFRSALECLLYKLRHGSLCRATPCSKHPHLI